MCICIYMYGAYVVSLSMYIYDSMCLNKCLYGFCGILEVYDTAAILLVIVEGLHKFLGTEYECPTPSRMLSSLSARYVDDWTAQSFKSGVLPQTKTTPSHRKLSAPGTTSLPFLVLAPSSLRKHRMCFGYCMLGHL